MRQVARFAVRGDAQHEIAAQRKPREHHRHAGELLRERAHRAHHLGQPAGMEQLTIQVMSGAVIAQVEAHDLETQRRTRSARSDST